MSRLVHQALLYDRDDDLLGTAVPFLHEGIEAGDTVLAVGSAGSLARLRRALGPGAAEVRFADSAEWYDRPVRTIAAYSAFVADNPAARLRVIAEPRRGGGTPAEISEWIRYESIVNVAFRDVDASVLCLYDRRLTDPDVLDGAWHTHPELVGRTGPRPNEAYLDPCVIRARVDGVPLPPAPPDAVTVPVDGTDLSLLRTIVSGYARSQGMGRPRLNDLLIATTEVTTNAVRHGRPPVVCRLWAEGDDLIADVTDGGHWEPDDAPGFMPPDPRARIGFGLWGVRMLCALVQLRTGPSGTTVRLRVPRR